MTPLEFCKQLKGVFGFPVTPFKKDLSLDLDGLARNVEEMVQYPFCALVAAGVDAQPAQVRPRQLLEPAVGVLVLLRTGRQVV